MVVRKYTQTAVEIIEQGLQASYTGYQSVMRELYGVIHRLDVIEESLGVEEE